MKNSLLKNKDIQFSLLLFVLLWVFQIIVVLMYYPSGFNFGYEFGKTATSILQGNGYANPWGGNTGSTAAVLPVLVYLHYIVFAAFGKTLTSYLFISFIKFAAYGFTYYFILRCFKLNKIKINYLIYSGLFLLFVSFSPTLIFKHTGDLWIYTFLVAWFLYALSNYFKDNRKAGVWNFVFFLFISPMINPSIALAGLAVFGMQSLLVLFNLLKTDKSTFLESTKKILISRKNKILLRNIILFPIIFSIPIFLWSYRNYVVFDTFIPTKSNLWLEYYLSNIQDEDGLLSYSTVVKYHPATNDSITKEVYKKGEIAVMDELKTLGKDHRKKHKDVYYRKLLNRIINTFMYTEYDMDVVQSKSYDKFNTEDKLILSNKKLVVHNYWTCLDLSIEEFTNITESYNFENKKLIIEDWHTAKREYYKRKNSARTVFRGLIMGVISTLALIFLLIFRKSRNNLLINSSILFYIIYILPYIIFSHQLRYQRPLFAIQIVLIYCLIYYLSNGKRIKFLKLKWE